MALAACDRLYHQCDAGQKWNAVARESELPRAFCADAKIESHKLFLPGEALEYEVSGGGGTDFRPVFEYIDQQISYPTLLLYFTDGYGTFPQEEVSYDVMWVMPKKVDVPFGEVMVLD